MKERTALVFAGELDRSTRTLERDGVIGLLTPSGAWCPSLYAAGALVEVEWAEERPERARVADPTGAFRLLLPPPGVGPSDALADLAPPAFVAFTGAPRIFRGEVIVRPEHLAPVKREVRDAWVLYAAEETLNRLEELAAARSGSPRGEAAQAALQHYSPTAEDLLDLAGMVRTAVSTVADSVREGPSARAVILEILTARGGAVAVPVEEILAEAQKRGIGPREGRGVLDELLAEGECYAPRNGHVRLL